MDVSRWVYYAVAGLSIGSVVVLGGLCLGVICQASLNISPTPKTTTFLGTVCWLFV